MRVASPLSRPPAENSNATTAAATDTPFSNVATDSMLHEPAAWNVIPGPSPGSRAPLPVGQCPGLGHRGGEDCQHGVVGVLAPARTRAYLRWSGD